MKSPVIQKTVLPRRLKSGHLYHIRTTKGKNILHLYFKTFPEARKVARRMRRLGLV